MMDSKAASLPISFVVLTHNEEPNLDACLESVTGWLGEVFVVDSGSSDSTLAIAAKYRAQVIHHPFETHARQWAWVLENIPFKYEWIFGLDADQRVAPGLHEALYQLFYHNRDKLRNIDGIYVRRRQIFRNKWIRHGGYYPKLLLKIFRRGQAQTDERDLMDHHFYVAGPTLSLAGDIVEDNRKEADISFWIEKHNRYAVLQAQEELLRRTSIEPWPIQPSLVGSADQRVVWIKQRWYKMPLYVRPLIYFIYRYIFQLGFLDGKQGFVFHFLQAYWYRLLVDINLDDLISRTSVIRVDGNNDGSLAMGETH